jgi:RNA polymerase sigma-70 factor (ECF subfamily)
MPAEDRFEDLFRGYYTRARGLARRRFPQLDAEEIAQEVMLRVLTHLDSIDGRRDPWPYIATITMNVGRDMVRSLHPTAALDHDDVDGPVAPPADEELLQAEVDDRLRSVLGQLSPAGRQVLTLHAYGDMSIGQIAAFLGCNDNAVRQKLFRARRQFVRVMDEVAAATAAVVAVLGWLTRRPAARGSGRVVVSASAMTLSGALFTVFGIATIHAITGVGGQAASATGAVVLSNASTSVVHQRTQPAAAPVVPTRTAAVRPVGTAAGPAEVSVSHGSLLTPGRTNEEHIVIQTAAGVLRITNTGENNSARGKVCKTGLITCNQ